MVILWLWLIMTSIWTCYDRWWTSYDILWHLRTSYDILWFHMTSYDYTYPKFLTCFIVAKTTKRCFSGDSPFRRPWTRRLPGAESLGQEIHRLITIVIMISLLLLLSLSLYVDVFFFKNIVSLLSMDDLSMIFYEHDHSHDILLAHSCRIRCIQEPQESHSSPANSAVPSLPSGYQAPARRKSQFQRARYEKCICHRYNRYNRYNIYNLYWK